MCLIMWFGKLLQIWRVVQMIAPCSFKVLHMSVIKDGIFFFLILPPTHEFKSGFSSLIKNCEIND